MGTPRAAPAAGLTVETLTRSADLAALVEDYDRLNGMSSFAQPFSLYEWHSTWCEHFLASGKAIEDSLHVHVVRDVTRRCVAIVPMIHTRRTVGPFRVQALNIIGADQALTEIRMPLIAPGFEAAVAQALHARFAGKVCWDWVQWVGITSTFGEALAPRNQLRWQEPLPDYVLDLPDDWEVFRSGLKRNIRESIRHCYNSLKRDDLAFSFVTLSAPQEIEAGLDQFLRLHALRAGLAGTVRHPDRFATAQEQAFLRDVCARLAGRGATRIFQLVIGGQVVATRIGFVVGKGLYLYYSGYDPGWSRYSVMTTTIAEIIKHSIAQGLQTVNLSPGTDVSKTRWGPRLVPIARAVQVRPRLWSRLVRLAYERANRQNADRAWMAAVLLRYRRRWS